MSKSTLIYHFMAKENRNITINVTKAWEKELKKDPAMSMKDQVRFLTRSMLNASVELKQKTLRESNPRKVECRTSFFTPTDEYLTIADINNDYSYDKSILLSESKNNELQKFFEEVKDKILVVCNSEEEVLIIRKIINDIDLKRQVLHIKSKEEVISNSTAMSEIYDFTNNSTDGVAIICYSDIPNWIYDIENLGPLLTLNCSKLLTASLPNEYLHIKNAGKLIKICSTEAKVYSYRIIGIVEGKITADDLSVNVIQQSRKLYDHYNEKIELSSIKNVNRRIAEAINNYVILRKIYEIGGDIGSISDVDYERDNESIYTILNHGNIGRSKEFDNIFKKSISFQTEIHEKINNVIENPEIREARDDFSKSL
jgi:hypothetical protein